MVQNGINILYSNRDYLDDVEYVANLDLPWGKLDGALIMVSGASGLIGSFLIDVIATKVIKKEIRCEIYAIGRNKDKLNARFKRFEDNSYLKILECDINQPIHAEQLSPGGYFIHLASNTHPLLYARDPIGTIKTNIIGLSNLLDCAVDNQAAMFVFASSNEIYGENRGDVEFFTEEYCGYINSNTLRAGYPESKRCGEALCQAYAVQRGINVVVPRLTRSFGPTMQMTDSKAVSQFIKCGLNNSNIVLKSQGMQFYSYTYVADAVSGLLTTMLKGKSGEAYNIADEESDIRLRDLAQIVADNCGTKVVYEMPDAIEASGYSKATKARLKNDKIKQLGWSAHYNIEAGVKRTLKILKDISIL